MLGACYSALKHLRAAVIKVTDIGKLVVSYYMEEQWLKHRHEMNSLSQSEIDKAKENSQKKWSRTLFICRGWFLCIITKM